MKQATPKEKILKSIRRSLIHKIPAPFPQADQNSLIHPAPVASLDILFAEQFIAAQGKFVYCEDEGAFMQNLGLLSDEKNWNHLFCWDTHLQEIFVRHDFRKGRIGKNLDKADAGITRCEALIARTGSVLLSSALASGRSLSVFPPVHIVVATIDQLVYDIKDGISALTAKYGAKLPSYFGLATGPSRTADIEKTLVLGAHGPREVYVFLTEATKL